ncbi:TetR/AcrR family transcriptional regulator, partial [Enterococcus gallinarum]|uniref:TetR/AcrR family transcriptional regulator n=1 Tax=Enterococcus gallinarum TaxID=1353 RepID=UPI003D0B3EDF
MDELVRESGLAKASVYRLFATKDELVAAYLRRLADTIFAQIDHDTAAHADRPERALGLLLDAVRRDLARPEFRGCSF